MSKCIFYFKNYLINIKSNLFIVTQLIFMLLILNANISDVMYIRSTTYYCDDIKPNIYFLSGATKGSVELGDVSGFYDFIDTIKSYNFVKDVGYQLEEGLYLKDRDDVVIPSIYLNTTMQKIKYPLKEGRWFNEDNIYNDIEIVLGGNIANDYRIGDDVILLSTRFINNKVEYKEINAVIVGLLQDPAYAINLGVSASKPTYNNLFDEYDNIILSNSDEIINYDGIVRYPLGSIILELSESSDYSALSQHGQLFSFNEINENSIDAYYKNITNKLPSVIIVFIAIVLGIVGTTYLYIYRFMKTATIYYLNGMSYKECKNLIMINNIISIILSIICSFLVLLFIPSLKDSLFTRNPIGVINLIITTLFFVIIILISKIILKHFSKDTIYRTLRRFE